MSMPTGRTVAALTTLTVTLPLTLAASAAAAPREVVYDALGDSYAAGYGAGAAYDADLRCARTSTAPAVRLDGRKQIELDDFVACSGARTADLALQLPALDADTDLVTLTIGGNDIMWAQAVGACLALDDAVCAQALAGSTSLIQTALPPALDAAFASIEVAAPEAHVVVTGYPHLFSPEYGAIAQASPAEQEALNDGADLLNATVAAAAQRHGFAYVDVVDRFDGHGSNAPEPWIDPVNFHPNLAGQEAYAAALTAGINPRDLR